MPCLWWKGAGVTFRKGTLGEGPCVDVCVWLYGRSLALLSHPPTVLFSGQGLHYPSWGPNQNWEVIGFLLPLPSLDMQPGPRDSSSKSPHCCCRALVWPPSSSPDSVHSLLPVSLPPRHSLPHVARGIFLKRTSGYFPSLHKSFCDALWPAG